MPAEVLPAETLLLALLFLAVATLYSSVGHAGASGYLGAMAFVGLAPETMRPTALALNILVAALVTVRFARAGLVPWATLAPFLLGSVPLAFVGGAVRLPASIYGPLVGVVLLLAAARLFAAAGSSTVAEARHLLRPLPAVAGAAVGAILGLLSGLTGTGGGIFLTPVLLFARWAETRAAAGASSVFILANSVAGLAGNVAGIGALPPAIPLWLIAVAAGAVVGSRLGTRRLAVPTLRRALAAVLVIAGLKLIVLG